MEFAYLYRDEGGGGLPGLGHEGLKARGLRCKLGTQFGQRTLRAMNTGASQKRTEEAVGLQQKATHVW
jgi:hypothetical protein